MDAWTCERTYNTICACTLSMFCKDILSVYTLYKMLCVYMCKSEKSSQKKSLLLGILGKSCTFTSWSFGEKTDLFIMQITSLIVQSVLLSCKIYFIYFQRRHTGTYAIHRYWRWALISNILLGPLCPCVVHKASTIFFPSRLDMLFHVSFCSFSAHLTY